MAVIAVFCQNFHQAGEHFFLHAVLRVHEGSQLFCKVNGLINGYLRRHFFILLEQEGECANDLHAFCLLTWWDGNELVVLLHFRQFVQEVREGLDGRRAEDFVQDLNLVAELPGDSLEAVW